MLVERDGELSAIETALDEACRGRGSVVLVTGPAGIGKTAVLHAARDYAAARNVRTLIAAGGEFEQDLAFSALDQLFGPTLRTLPDAARDNVLSGAACLARPVFDLHGPGPPVRADPAAVNSVVHGLYWICLNLANSGPMLLAVDDMHWADEPSLRFLSYLARRITDLPILLMLAGRPVSADHLASRALVGVRPRRLALAPLSAHAVETMVREILSEEASDEFCQACATASGGNPFLLTEALIGLRAARVRPVDAEKGRVEWLQPETISRAVLARICRAGPDATRVARAIAVLGPAADLRRVATLAAVPTPAATELLDRLADEAIVSRSRPIEFVHPLIRAAAYGSAGEYVRAAEHRRAAELLHHDGVAADDLVPHLLAAMPDADPWVVRTLRDAAATAVARGAPEVAVSCLGRALAEPPEAPETVPIMVQLGRSLGMANRPDAAAEVFRNAHDAAEKNEIRAEIALELGKLMLHTGRSAEAVAAYELARTATDHDDVEQSARLIAVFTTALASTRTPATWIGQLDEIMRRQPAPDTRRLVAASLAFGAAATGDRPAGEIARLATIAATGPVAPDLAWHLANFAGAAFAIADRLPDAVNLLDRAIAAARARGDAAEYRYLAAIRSHTMLYAGKLLEAEADGRAAYQLSDDGGDHDTPLAAAVLADALLERGALAEAEQVLTGTEVAAGGPMRMLIEHFGLMARGRLRLRQGRTREALADLRACGEALTAAGYVNPGFALWRSEATLAHLQLGEADAAHEIAEENLELSRRFGAPFPIGVALHSAGLVEGGATGLSLLEEAVAVLHESTTDLWRGHALVDYGAALRRAGRRRKAQEPLREGLDVATRCGATALATRAAEELVAAGARPRRARVTGPEALTASELRVARFAADGATNRDIAQALFVSLRTVELHLTRAYRKLGIASRHELAAALRPVPEG